ncbi:MAG: peptide chain release factor N(5)-glutamine methyltransferase [Bacteroidales bacterium]
MQTFMKHIKTELGDIYPENETDAITLRILRTLFNIDRVQLILNKDRIFSAEEREALERIIIRLKNNEPIQYILGEEEFFGRKFKVAPGVLIPRSETEELVELIINENPANVQILDIGTGSGCIAITLKLEMPQSNVSGWDISTDALEIAISNSNKLNAKINFVHQDVLAPDTHSSEKVDIIVSNPPYVMDSEKLTMHSNVLEFEPHTALFVSDEDPLLFYRRIAELGLEKLNKPGKLYFEINSLLGEETACLLKDLGYSNVRLIKDLYGRDRIVSGELNH